MVTSTRRNASRLNCDSVTASSRSVDWSEALDENCEGFRAADVDKCHDCGRQHVVTFPGGGGECGDAVRNDPYAYGIEEFSEQYDKAIDCTADLPEFEGPMMSAFWPCDHGLSIEAAARALDKFGAGAVCAVELADGETGFGLTGGGMDMSDQIAAAYVAVGHYPPAALRLERHMFHKADRRARRLLNAAVKSGRIAANWALQASRGNRRTLREVQLDAARADAVAALRAVCGEGVTYHRGDTGAEIKRGHGYNSSAEGQAVEVLALSGATASEIKINPLAGSAAHVDAVQVEGGKVQVSVILGTVYVKTGDAAPVEAPALSKALAKLRRALVALERCK